MLRAAVTTILLVLLAVPQVQSLRLLQSQLDSLDTDTATTYTCISSGVVQHACIVNPAYSFALQFGSQQSTSNLPDRVYNEIVAQHVLCKQLTTQTECQSTPASASLYCSWDAMNSRCLADPYASLLLPMSCHNSKARSFLTCGRKGAINACRTDPACVLAKQARCFPSWLVSEARAANVTEQAMAEATALAILKGDEAIVGSCDEAKLLQKSMTACPYTAGWEKCNFKLCELSTPTFIPARVQPLDLGNTTATVPAVYEAAMQPDSSSELPFYDTYPGPVCFPDISRLPMVLHGLLGVSQNLAQQLNRMQAMCAEQSDITFDVAHNIAACGQETFRFDVSSVYRAVRLQKPSAPAAAAVSSRTTSASSGALPPGLKTSPGIMQPQQGAPRQVPGPVKSLTPGKATSSPAAPDQSSSKVKAGSGLKNQQQHTQVPTDTEVGSRGER